MTSVLTRNVGAIADQHYDLVIIGAGINGVACAREAALRGLRVALVERGDFGAATSSNSSKIAHSGVRYLQHLDIIRMRESIRERNYLTRNAPHLVNSQPVMLPTYGHGIKGRETTSIYVKLYDMLSPDRQWFSDPAKKIPGSRMVSPAEVMQLTPGINSERLTGGAIWPEGQMHNTERLLLATLRSAAANGAQVANYTLVEKILLDDGRVEAVKVRDLLSGSSYTLSTGAVLNASGPWIRKTLENCGISCGDHGIHGSKAISLLTRPLNDSYVVSFPIKPMYEDKKALVNKGSSMMFAIPWRDCSLIGSLHLPCDDDPDKVTVSDAEVNRYIELINEGYPAARLRREDVRNVLWGIVPAEEPASAAPLKHYKIIDHEQADGIAGLTSVVGVKFTTSRDVAQKAIDLVFRRLARTSPKSTSASTPVWGGDIALIDDFRSQVTEKYRDLLPEAAVQRLIDNFGSGCEDILLMIRDNRELGKQLASTIITHAEILYVIRQEMAVTLVDVIKRRTELGSLEYPNPVSIAECAQIMAAELGWDTGQLEAEKKALEQSYLWIPKAP